MTQPLFQFGQQLPQYNVPVMNERAVRASGQNQRTVIAGSTGQPGQHSIRYAH
ncbi:hypothetical protein HUU62_14335 [Rhodoferax sp. 4810]|nr:hypothetical protein [Rhodoferax jenense]